MDTGYMYFDYGDSFDTYDVLADSDNEDSTFFVGDTAMTVLLQLDCGSDVDWSVAMDT